MISWMISHVDLSLYDLNESTVDPLSLTVLLFIHLKMASIQLHVKPEFNYEEAAHAASDIVGSEPLHILEPDK
jgi:hypothetical protein